MALSLTPVRRLAETLGYVEHGVDDVNRVISLITHEDATLRISIYYDTGTIRLWRRHPLQPCTSQVVVLNVSLDRLGNILQHPHSCGAVAKLQSYSLEPETVMLRKHYAYLGAALAGLNKQRSEVSRALKAACLGKQASGCLRRGRVVGCKRSFDEMMGLSLLCKQEKGGMCRHWSFYPDQVARLWRCGGVACVAMIGRATVMVYASGRVDCTSGTPPFLLHQLTNKASAVKLEYVSLGSHGRYFFRGANGTVDWCGGCDKFNEMVKSKGGAAVSCVAFGPHPQAYFVRFSHGEYVYSGLGLDFSQCLKRCNKHGEIADVALGPLGEWWVSFQDGHWECGNVVEEVEEVLAGLRRQARTLVKVVFGGEHAYFIRYW